MSLTFYVYKRELSTPVSQGLPGSQEERYVPKVSDAPKPPLIVVAQGRQGTGGKNYTQLPRPGDFCSEANKSTTSRGFDACALCAVNAR